MFSFRQRHRLVLTISVFFIVALSLAEASAQSGVDFKRYTINEGLSQNAVFSLLEDKDGLLWIGIEETRLSQRGKHLS